MLKKIAVNTAVKKALIFLTVFAFSGALLGSQLANQRDSVNLQNAGYKVRHMQASVDTVMDISDIMYRDTAGEVPLTSMIRTVASDAGDEMDGDSHGAARSLAEILQSQRENQAFSDEQDQDRGSAVTTAKKNGFVYLSELPISQELQKYTYDVCQEKGLEYELVLALMWRESRFQVDAVGYNSNGTRDHGIMQINDVNRGWLSEMGIDDLMDPKQNIVAGTTMLSKFQGKYGTHNALMAYQYGEVGMQSKLEGGVTTSRQIQILYSKRDDFKALVQEAGE